VVDNDPLQQAGKSAANAEIKEEEVSGEESGTGRSGRTLDLELLIESPK